MDGWDARLVESASGGDARAAERLLEHYWPDLERFLARRAGGVRGAVESGSDLAQSVCREVLAHLRDERLRFQGEAEFRRWLFNAAALKLAEKRRYWGADMRDGRRELHADSNDDARERFFLSLCTPSADAMRREELAKLRAAFDALDQDQRQIIELAHFEGLPHSTIAQRLGIGEANSRMRLSRALARLATLAARG